MPSGVGAESEYAFWRARTASLSTTGSRVSQSSKARPLSQASTWWAALRPSPTARVMSVGPWTASPAANTCGTSVWQVADVAGEAPVLEGRDAVAEGGRVRAHADRGDDDVGLDGHVGARDGLGGPAARRVRRAEAHLDAAQAGDGALRVAEDLGRGHQQAEVDALLLGVGGLHVVGRHLVARAAVGDRHGGGAQAPGGPRGIHGDVAAADHDHAPAGDLDRVVELDLAQEVRAAEDAQAVLARDAEARSTGGCRWPRAPRRSPRP